PVEVSIDGQPPLPLPLRALMPLGEHEVVVAADGAETRRYTVVSNPSGAARLDLANARVAADKTSKRVSGERARSAAELLQLAREQRSRGLAAAALDTYR